jgi:uncharacterized membrane protein
LKFKILGACVTYLLQDYFVFVLALFLIVTLLRAAPTIKIVRKYLCSDSKTKTDEKFSELKSAKNTLVREVLWQFALLLRDFINFIMFVVILIL